MKNKIILASSSPRRAELLTKAGIEHEMVPSEYEEDHNLNLKPHEFVKFIATLKARDVASRAENALVIGADTIVVLGNKIFGKPKNRGEAKKMLLELSGTTHSVITGFAIFDTEKDTYIADSDEAKVSLRKISDEEIDRYIATNEPLDKAGAYAIQEMASIFVESVKGSPSTVIGLPMTKVVKELRKMGYAVTDQWKSNG